MEELKNLFHEVANDAISMSQYTMDNCPNVKRIDECFPYTAYRTINISGKDYRVAVDIQMTEVRW